MLLVSSYLESVFLLLRGWPCSQDFAKYLHWETKTAGWSISWPRKWIRRNVEDVNDLDFSFGCFVGFFF